MPPMIQKHFMQMQKMHAKDTLLKTVGIHVLFVDPTSFTLVPDGAEIGRASCRERV